MKHRYFANLSTTRWQLRRCFGPAALQAIEAAIAQSETEHSGELRFAIEAAIDLPALVRGESARDRARNAFTQLEVWNTRANNGVLIYLLLAEHTIEIISDRGFDGLVTPTQWRDVCEQMQQLFTAGEFEAGALRGIALVSELISQHFPADPNDRNELPDKPAIL